MEHIEKLIKTLKLDTLDSNESLVFVKQKTTLRPSQVTLALSVLITIVLVIMQASTLVICFGCFIVPAYYSFHSLQNWDNEKCIKYLTYWVVFSFTQIVSFFFEWILGSTIYSLARVALTVALLHPSTQLSTKVYYRIIAPFMMEHERIIDSAAEQVVNKGKDVLDQLEEKGKKQLDEQAKKLS